MKRELPEEAKRKQKERVRRAGVTGEDWKFREENKTLRKPRLLQVCIQLCRLPVAIIRVKVYL